LASRVYIGAEYRWFYYRHKRAMHWCSFYQPEQPLGYIICRQQQQIQYCINPTNLLSVASIASTLNSSYGPEQFFKLNFFIRNSDEVTHKVNLYSLFVILRSSSLFMHLFYC